MTEPGGGLDRSSMVDPERQALVREIDDQNKEVFLAWAKDHKETLDFTFGAVSYFAPPKLLEIAEDPASIVTTIAHHSPNQLELIIYEGTTRPLSDPETFDRLHDKARQLPPLPDLSQPQQATPPIARPENIDDMHYHLLGKPEIGLTDKAYYWITLQLFKKELHVGQFRDREQLRGQRVTTDFYNRLREIAEEIGCEIITGENTQPNPNATNELEINGNIDYYTKKLGRKTLLEIPEQMQREIQQNHGNSIHRPDLFTVDILHPEK